MSSSFSSSHGTAVPAAREHLWRFPRDARGIAAVGYRAGTSPSRKEGRSAWPTANRAVLTCFQPVFSVSGSAVICSPLIWSPRRCGDGEAVPGSMEGRLSPGRSARTPLPVFPPARRSRALPHTGPDRKTAPRKSPWCSAVPREAAGPQPLLGRKNKPAEKTTQRAPPGQELMLQRGFSSPRQSPSLRKSWKRGRSFFPKDNVPGTSPHVYHSVCSLLGEYPRLFLLHPRARGHPWKRGAEPWSRRVPRSPGGRGAAGSSAGSPQPPAEPRG